MSKNTGSAAVGFVGISGVVAGIVLSPPFLRILTGIEMSSRSANTIAWVMALFMMAVGVILVLKRKQITFRSLVSGLASIVFLIALIEGVLQVAARVNPRLDFILSGLPPLVEDATLGYRLSPLHPEHDELGFRNVTVPKTAYLVTVGDSQTYGDNASIEGTYPAQLEQIIGKDVYNMAAGGYSPPQYLELFRQAVSFKPQVIVAGLYSGNDLQEAYWFVYLDKKSRELMSADPAFIDSLYQQERLKPSSYVAKSFNVHRSRFKFPNFLRAGLRVLVSAFESKEQHWELYKQQAIKDDDFVLDAKSQRTIFTPRKRFSALDLTDVRIKEGLDISLDALGRMKKIADRDGITFITLLIPTKELVYSDLVSGLEDYPVPEIFIDLIKAETEVWSLVKADLDRKGITYIDALPRLQQALSKGERIYSPNNNGHPDAEGYGVMASTIADWLEARRTATP